MMTSRRLPILLACAVVPPALGASCATESEILRVDEASITEAPHDQADAGAPIEIVEVEARGAGCPKGSWKIVPSSDGTEHTVHFDDFALSLSTETAAVRTTACNVSFRIRTPKNATYAVRSVEYTGDADLGPEVHASFLDDVAFTGIGVGSAKTGRLDITRSGPFTFAHEIEQPAWAPCDMTSNLQLRTRLTLETKGAGKGAVRVARLGKVRFQTGPCTLSAVDGGVSDAGTPAAPVASIDAGPTSGAHADVSAIPIVRVTTAGNGCSGQTAKSVIAPDGRSFTVGFDDFAVSTTPARSNAYCRVAIDVTAPKGKSYALESFAAQGHAALPVGAAVRLIGLTDFTGAGVDQVKEKTTVLSGPLSGPISLEETFSAAQLNYSRCDAEPGNLGLRFRAVLQAPSGAASSFDIQELSAFKFAVRDCP